MFVDQFSEESQHILSKLQSNPQSLFMFLKTAVDIHLQRKLDFSSLESCHEFNSSFGIAIKNDFCDVGVYLERLANFPKILHQNTILVTDEIAELYLEVNSTLWFCEL